jgi:BCD family chlorophyll transporter-like MFS transporter
MRQQLGWLGILRLGLVQAALGSIVVLTTSTLNRVMVVELGLAAIIPGALVGLHYGVQIARPLWGHGSDRGGRRTPWIVGGMALLSISGTAAAASVALMETYHAAGLALAIAAFVFIGAGIGAAGTSMLALLASSVAPSRRPAAAMTVWLMMIFGIAVTAVVTGKFLDPFSMARLVAVTAATGALALAVTSLAVAGLERSVRADTTAADAPAPPFRESLADAWHDPQARLFTIFVFVSMLAYSMQDLVLEPFGGMLFAMTPGETTSLAGVQNGGVFIGMLLAGLAGSHLSHRHPAILGYLTVGGCLLSAAALVALASAARVAPDWPLTANVAALGFANGIFAVAAIASMMALAGAAGPSRVGLRMGLWGASQAIAFGLGGFVGTVAVDLIRALSDSVALAYGGVFLLEGVVFLVAAAIAARIAMADSAARLRPAALQPAE